MIDNSGSRQTPDMIDSLGFRQAPDMIEITLGLDSPQT